MRNQKKNRIFDIIIYIILIACLYFAYDFYQQNNFNDFIKSETKLNISEFKRDKEIKYNKTASYKIKSETFNDAMFYKTIKVQKNKPYKVTCMVKTENVEVEENKIGSGAQIVVEGTTEKSTSITGTNDWTKLEFIFNSKNREEVNIGFRLGGYIAKAKGEVWFSNFTIEEGQEETNSDWNFACFIFTQTQVNIDNNEINLEVTKQDITDIKNTLKRFEASCSSMPEGKMSANCDVYEVEKPITSLAYDKEYGYYVSPENVEQQIKDFIIDSDYDHIFIVVRLGDEEHQKDIEVNDWIGLGGMDYYGIGFSNIRLPNSNNSYTYKYNKSINRFPEEVFIHEFLHTLERNSEEYGYKIPELHDYEKYGYKNERLEGQKKWYIDYMNCNINTQNGKIGLPSEIYLKKPAKTKNFINSHKLDEFKQPENIIEVIQEIINKIIERV